MSELPINFDELRLIEANSTDRFLAIFEREFKKVTDELREVKAEQESKTAMNDQLLKKDQLAEKLQVSISTVSKMQTEGLPTISCGTAVRFDYIEIKEWLKSRRNNKCGNVPAERVSIPLRTQSSSNGK